MTSWPLLQTSGRLLVFGGSCGNLQATEALLAEAGRLSISSQEMLCTGDLAAYCADPQATVDLIREAGITCVLGNCEESLGSNADDCGCGFEEGTACDLLSQQWYAFNRAALDSECKRWMANLPRAIEVKIAGRSLLAVHGGASNINRFIFPSTPAEVKERELDLAGSDGIIAGHSGLPFASIHGGRLWLNSGALGMPANDGTPRTWYALIEGEEDALSISLKALDYDHAKAASRMRDVGLKNGYADCLESGRWPSLDVLPDIERENSGQATSEVHFFWPK